MKNSSTDKIKLLIDGMDEISKADTVSLSYKLLTKLIANVMDVDGAQILFYDKKTNEFYEPDDNGHKVLYKLSNPKGLLGRAFFTGKPAIYNYALSEKEFDRDVDIPNNERIRSLLYVPIFEDEELIGMIRLYCTIRNTKAFIEEDIKLVQSLLPLIKKIMHVIEMGAVKKVDSFEQETKTAQNAIDEYSIEQEKSNDDKMMMRISTMVHDIRTPANALAGFLELLEEKITDKRLLEYIHNAKESADFINTLTTSILHSVKHGSKSVPESKEVVYTSRYFSSILETFTAGMHNKNIDYSIYIDPKLPKEIKVDSIKLKRVLINLVGNAWKFTPHDKSVTVAILSNKERDRVKIMVQDTGIGIDEEMQQEIFEAFKQVEGVEGEVEGSGLGLAIVQQYVQQMGGKLELRSKLDKGSMFQFSIPVEVINSDTIIPKYASLDKKVAIITNNKDDSTVKWIQLYLKDFGLPANRVSVGGYSDDATHLIIFENSLNEDIVNWAKSNDKKIILVEERLLSLSSRDDYSDYHIITKGTFYGIKLYNATYYKPPAKVLIIEDNKINVTLLQAVLENEYCDIEVAYSGSKALEMLAERGDEDQKPYDIIFLDKYLKDMDGDEIADFVKSRWQDVYIVSITGDPKASINLNQNYDIHIEKPFSKTKIQKVIREFVKDDTKNNII